MDRILLVDDDPHVLRGMAHQLEEEGYQVAQASSGKRALERLTSEHFDLVVADLLMEAPNGLELLEHTRRRELETAFIISTGYGDVRSAIESLRLGADDYLLKPTDPEELLFRIRSCIDRRRLKRYNDELERRAAERAAQLEREIDMHKAARDALSRSLNEKELLLREIQHRVKNNLATISGLINLQGAMSHDKSVGEVITSLKNRVRAIHLVYERLYNGQDLARIDYRDYVETLSKGICRLMSISPQDVSIEIDIDGIEVDIDTSIPLGLIITELLTNSLTHAFPGDSGGKVLVRLERREDGLHLTVQDDGVGLPEGVSLSSRQTLGFRLISSLIEQMGGTVNLSREGGTRIEIRIPVEEVS